MFPKVLADDFEAEELCNPPQAGSYLLVLKRGNSRTVFVSQYHRASTLTHKPLLHLKEKTLREEKQTGEGERTEEEEEDGRAQMKSSGGAQFTEAALNQPITVKENISWCVSFPREEERMKGEEGKCI